MDGMTRATLWIAALVLGTYFATTFLNCALDARCKLRCAPVGVDTPHASGGCVYSRTQPEPIVLDKEEAGN
jgi:hypothetical protein